MLGHRELTPEDYLAIVKRRRWQILLSVLIIPPLVLATTFVIPPRYVSQTLVLIQQQRVPDDFVKPVLTEDLDARLAAMREQILVGRVCNRSSRNLDFTLRHRQSMHGWSRCKKRLLSSRSSRK